MWHRPDSRLEVALQAGRGEDDGEADRELQDAALREEHDRGVEKQPLSEDDQLPPEALRHGVGGGR